MSKSIKSFFKPVAAATPEEGKVGSDLAPDEGHENEGKGVKALGKKRKIEVISSAAVVSSVSKSEDQMTSINSSSINSSSSSSDLMSVGAPVTSWIPVDQLSSWIPILQKEFSKPYFSRLDLFLEREFASRKIFPPRELVFSAFSACAFQDIKVVVIGQDPYHGPNQAHGLAFSVMKPEKPPPSLRNIFKEAKNDLPGFAVPSHGDLSGWSRQGVFLLNTCLTVQQGNANSHQKRGWEEFITAVIRAIDQRDDGVVFMLWGKPANERCAHISRDKHTVISSSHPSPLGATKTKAPFIGSRCFSRCNEALVAGGKEPIDWTL